MDSAKDGTDPHSRGVYKGVGHGGLRDFAPNGCMIVHNINIFVKSGVLKIAREKTPFGRAVGDPPRTLQGELTALPHTP